jgi:hypothetical protein
MYAQPVDERTLEQPVETELTLAARGSVDNANQITQADEYKETDFTPERDEQIKEARAKRPTQKSPQSRTQTQNSRQKEKA